MLLSFFYFTGRSEKERQISPKNTTGKGGKGTQEKGKEEVKGGGEGT